MRDEKIVELSEEELDWKVYVHVDAVVQRHLVQVWGLERLKVKNN